MTNSLSEIIQVAVGGRAYAALQFAAKPSCYKKSKRSKEGLINARFSAESLFSSKRSHLTWVQA
jgi:hypothetical protein